MAQGPLLSICLKLDATLRTHYEQRLSEQGYRVQFIRGSAELAAHLPECRFLLTGRPPRLDWSRANELSLIQVAGTGVDPLFPAHGLRETVHIAKLRGLHEGAVRDHIWALILAFARDLPRAIRQQAARAWTPYTSVPLTGRTLTLLGLGGIGTRVARVAKAMDMRVVAVRRSGTSAPEADRVHPPEELAAPLRETDYLVVCLPLTSQTRHMLSENVLAELPARAVLINVSRGGIVDEAALEASLVSGRLAGAALDVFRDEPLPTSSRLWSCPNLLITPHSAGWTSDYVERVLDVFVENVARVRQGLEPNSPVSRALEY